MHRLTLRNLNLTGREISRGNRLEHLRNYVSIRNPVSFMWLERATATAGAPRDDLPNLRCKGCGRTVYVIQSDQYSYARVAGPAVLDDRCNGIGRNLTNHRQRANLGRDRRRDGDCQASFACTPSGQVTRRTSLLKELVTRLCIHRD